MSPELEEAYVSAYDKHSLWLEAADWGTHSAQKLNSQRMIEQYQKTLVTDSTRL